MNNTMYTMYSWAYALSNRYIIYKALWPGPKAFNSAIYTMYNGHKPMFELLYYSMPMPSLVTNTI